MTDAQGEARFRLAVAQSEADLVVEVAAPALPQVAPVQFLAIIGEVDTPGVPVDLAVAGDVVFVAANQGSLQVLDVRDPTQPVQVHRNIPMRFPDGRTWARALALQGTRAYVAADPPRLHIVDITAPLAATFLADANFDRISDVVLRSIDLPAAVQTQTVRAVAVQGAFAYVLTNDLGNALGTLQVVRIDDPATAQVVHSLTLPVPRPTGLVVAGEVAYVPAGTAGLLVFDLRDPARPVLVTTLGDPDPTDAVATELASGLALAGRLRLCGGDAPAARHGGAGGALHGARPARPAGPPAPRHGGAAGGDAQCLVHPGDVRGRAHRGGGLCLPGARHPGAPGGRYPPSRCAPAGRASADP